MSDVSMIDGHIDETKLKDEDTIKALECCSGDNGMGDCTKCPNFKDFCDCKENLSKCALDLIKRKDEQINGLIAGQETLQKHLAEKNAEIEMLQSDLERYRQGIKNLVKKMGGEQSG